MYLYFFDHPDTMRDPFGKPIGLPKLPEDLMIKLYSDAHCPNSHRTRIVLAEKELPVTTIELEADNLPADFMQINPYGKLPTVIDRDIVFFESAVRQATLPSSNPLA